MVIDKNLWIVLASGEEELARPESWSRSTSIAYAGDVYTWKDGTEYTISNQFFVQFNPLVSEELIDSLNGSYDVTISQKNEWMGNNYLLEVDWESDRTALELANLYHQHPLTEFATPDFLRLVWSYRIPDDPDFGSQWGLAKISAPDAWDISTGSSAVTVAVLDTGVDLNHEDLDDKLLSGFDVTDDPDGSPQPRYERDAHGTGCAGIVAAETNNGQGMAGVSWGSRLMPVQVFYSSQIPDFHPLWCRSLVVKDKWIVDGFGKAVSSGADILSNSWGGGNPSAQVQQAITTAVQNGRNGKGCVVVFASGNSNSGVSFPASASGVLAVGATNERDKRADPSDWGNMPCIPWNKQGSNFGPGLDVVAPGNNIRTTDVSGSGGYDAGNYTSGFGGTSAAAPFVAGIAALILSVNPDLEGEEVQQVIQDTSDRLSGYAIDTNGWNQEVGYGRVNAHRALQALLPSLVKPTATDPTYAGTYNNPQKLIVEVRAWRGFRKDDFSVSIGGEPATIVTAVALEGGHALAVMPPTQSSNGLYDIAVTIGPNADTKTRAVLYADATSVDVDLVHRSLRQHGRRRQDGLSQGSGEAVHRSCAHRRHDRCGQLR